MADNPTIQLPAPAVAPPKPKPRRKTERSGAGDLALRVLRRPVDKLAQIGADLRFYIKVLLHIPGTLRSYPKEVLRLLSEVSFGSGALAVIGGTIGVMLGLTLSVGFVVGMQGYAALDQIGASALNGFISAYFNTREVAPMVAALALSATVGSGFTAQLGAMKINEEVDALESMAIRPIPYLVSTRIIASLVVMVPLFLIGLVGTYVATDFMVTTFFGQSAGTYDHYFSTFVAPVDVLYAGIKVIVLTLIITLIHCYYGMTASGGPEGVGRSTGLAIRTSIVALTVFDILLTLALWGPDQQVQISG
jgi:phospholipid/cholesterol/gamma-HCH transport system permease protein